MKCKNRQMSFTPAHFCAFNGNLNMMNSLINSGANLMIPNDEGVKAIHCAAQGDQATMIYYLIKIKKFDIEEKDSNGNTALHWAVFTGAETSTWFLLALGANPNSLNQEIWTPLHLSVKSIENHGSIKIVKSLLLEGANRGMVDKDKKTPIDYVELISDPYIANDLLQILAYPKTWQWWMLKTPLKRLTKSRRILLQFYFSTT